MSGLRKIWTKAKSKAEKAGIPKSFFGHADLGPKLDAAEKEMDKYDDYHGIDSDKIHKLSLESGKKVRDA